jgi:hypothetical protein
MRCSCRSPQPLGIARDENQQRPAVRARLQLGIGDHLREDLAEAVISKREIVIPYVVCDFCQNVLIRDLLVCKFERYVV